MNSKEKRSKENNFYSIFDDDDTYECSIILVKKKGRIKKNSSHYRAHDKTKKDNIRSKILTHFMRFLHKFIEINFQTEIKKIIYRTKNTNVNLIKALFENKVEDYFSFETSKKYKEKNQNQEIFHNIKHLSPELLKMEFKEIYKKYYLQENESMKEQLYLNQQLNDFNFQSLLNEYINDNTYYKKIKNTGMNLIVDLYKNTKINSEKVEFLGKKTNKSENYEVQNEKEEYIEEDLNISNSSSLNDHETKENSEECLNITNCSFLNAHETKEYNEEYLNISNSPSFNDHETKEYSEEYFNFTNSYLQMFMK